MALLLTRRTPPTSTLHTYGAWLHPVSFQADTVEPTISILADHEVICQEADTIIVDSLPDHRPEPYPNICAHVTGQVVSNTETIVGAREIAYLDDESPVPSEGQTVQFPDVVARRRATRVRWPIWSDADLDSLPPPRWLVEGLIPEQSAVMLFGASGVGKSLVCLDLALSIASGTPWNGCIVKQGPVVYVSPEGVSGLPGRRTAWKRQRGISHYLPIHVISQPFSLLLQFGQHYELVPEWLTDLVQRIRALKPVLLILDPLARFVVGGDENSARDMGLAVAVLDYLREELGCTVLISHHTGRELAHERGSTALRAAMDTVLRLHAPTHGLSLVVDKQKDGEMDRQFGLRIDSDDDGHGGKSPVIVSGQVAPNSTPDSCFQRDKVARAALGVLWETFGELGATTGEWVDACVTAGIPKQTFFPKRAMLVQEGFVTDTKRKRGVPYTLTDAGRGALGLTLNSLS